MPDLSTFPVHLGLGASACAEPAFTGMDWYGPYIARHGDDGPEGRLVSLHSFKQDWDGWEMHPEGDEVVVCLDGAITLIQDIDGQARETALGARNGVGRGEYAINPRGVWHTANVASHARVLFITAGWGTQGRGR